MPSSAEWCVLTIFQLPNLPFVDIVQPMQGCSLSQTTPPHPPLSTLSTHRHNELSSNSLFTRCLTWNFLLGWCLLVSLCRAVSHLVLAVYALHFRLPRYSVKEDVLRYSVFETTFSSSRQPLLPEKGRISQAEISDSYYFDYRAQLMNPRACLTLVFLST